MSARTVRCIQCGAKSCGGINAVKHIESIGVGQIHDLKWAGRECKTSAGAVLDELPSQLEAKPTRSRSIFGRLLENPTPFGEGGCQTAILGSQDT